jgi:hypothetical protein
MSPSPQLFNSWTSLCEILFVYIVAPEPISTSYLTNLSHQSVCPFMYPHIVTRRRVGKNVTATTSIHATIDELLNVSPSMRSVLYQRKQAIRSWRNVLFFFFHEITQMSTVPTEFFMVFLISSRQIPIYFLKLDHSRFPSRLSNLWFAKRPPFPRQVIRAVCSSESMASNDWMIVNNELEGIRTRNFAP